MEHKDDETLKKYSGVVLASTVNMFFATALELYMNEHRAKKHINLALMDSFRIYARSLILFFYPNNSKPDDAKAQDFMKSGIEWSIVRRDKTSALVDLQKITGKEVAHLTYSRPFDPDTISDWDIGTEMKDLYLIFEDFIRYADPSKLHIRVIEDPARWLAKFRHYDSIKAARIK